MFRTAIVTLAAANAATAFFLASFAVETGNLDAMSYAHQAVWHLLAAACLCLAATYMPRRA